MWWIIKICFFGIVGMSIAIGTYDLIMGSENTKKLLETLHIPLTYDQTIALDFILIAIMLIVYFVKKDDLWKW